MIDRATVDKIIDAANIVDVVSDFVTLRKAGVNYKGLCPFHDDKNPSFMVSPAKNICHCFVCGKGGTPAGFLMEHEQMSYPDALRWLAKKYNIEIEERELSDDEKRAASERDSMYIVNEWAKGYFHDLLLNDIDGQTIGRQYFRSRGIRDDIIEKFQLGYALTKRDSLSKAAISKGYKEEFLIKTGLCFRTEKGEIIDRYSGRVIFPWFTVSGKVSAFGGRKLDSATKGVSQKYVNSPESEIYHKDHELYGLYQAKKAIAKEDCVYMVEGYTDVIAMHQCGLENVVANSGTALSIYQIKQLRKFSNNIVLLYDGDEAGIHAAMRGTDMLLAEGMNIKVLVLPDGDDPDSFARKHSVEEFKAYINNHQTDFIQFKTDMLLRGVTDPIKRSEAINSILKSVSVIPDQIVRDTYLRECTNRLEIKEGTAVSAVNKFIIQTKEEKAKEIERDKARMERLEAQGITGGTAQQAPVENNVPITTESTSTVQTIHNIHMSPDETIERMLIKMVVCHGEVVVLRDVEMDDGSRLNLTVAQYIDIDLGSDELMFRNPLYNQILAEAVAHCGDEEFKAETYFINHPDIVIGQLASQLTMDEVPLPHSLEMRTNEKTLQQQVEHLLLDFRMSVVKQHIKDLQAQLRQAGSNMQTVMQLMQELKAAQDVRNGLAQRLGNDVVV
ncbi:MAG: DNA primase [Prevotella sp.]|nr:DNA primase [Prevotella sp.]